MSDIKYSTILCQRIVNPGPGFPVLQILASCDGKLVVGACPLQKGTTEIRDLRSKPISSISAIAVENESQVRFSRLDKKEIVEGIPLQNQLHYWSTTERIAAAKLLAVELI